MIILDLVKEEESIKKVYIDGIRQGKGRRYKYLYASLFDAETNDCIISADLSYILLACFDRKYFIVEKP